MEIREIIEKIAKDKEASGGIKSVVWLAAGGSNGSNYPAQYFMDRESKTIRSQMFTSNEFVYAAPRFVDGNTVAIDIVDIMEGYGQYADAMAAYDILDKVYNDAKAYCMPLAEKWAQKNKEEHVITVMASGPAYAAGYIFSICNIMEMLQIQSPTINCCEFFHGPFEVLDKNESFFLLVSEGRTRRADERAVRFLKEYGGEKVYILDAKELGINRFKDSVAEYFNHMLFSPILNNTYMKQLSAAAKIDYMTRRYMWKVQY